MHYYFFDNSFVVVEPYSFYKILLVVTHLLHFISVQTDAPYHRVDDTGPPPSYDDVVSEPNPSRSVQPSAPPLDDLPTPSAYRPSAAVVDYTEPESTPGEQRRKSVRYYIAGKVRGFYIS